MGGYTVQHEQTVRGLHVDWMIPGLGTGVGRGEVHYEQTVRSLHVDWMIPGLRTGVGHGEFYWGGTNSSGLP